MNVIANSSRFDALQTALLVEIAQTIRREVERAGITGREAQRLTRDLTFQVCSVVDGCAILEHDGAPVTPVLTFEQPDGSLLYSGDGYPTSSMHEYALGTVDSLFGKEPGDF